MNYPSGDPIRQSDLIYWDGGVGIGCVIEIISTDCDFKEWGLAEPSIVINYDGSNSFDGKCIYIPERMFLIDGIEKLPKSEIMLLDDIVKIAREKSAIDVSAATAGIFSKFINGIRSYWFVVFYVDGEASVFVQIDPGGQVANLANYEMSPSPFV